MIVVVAEVRVEAEESSVFPVDGGMKTKVCAMASVKEVRDDDFRW